MTNIGQYFFVLVFLHFFLSVLVRSSAIYILFGITVTSFDITNVGWLQRRPLPGNEVAI